MMVFFILVCAGISIALYRARNHTAGTGWGVVTVLLVLVEIGTLVHSPDDAATTANQATNYDAYRDCLVNQKHTKPYCVQYAREYGESVSSADEALTPEPGAVDSDTTTAPEQNDAPEPTVDNHAVREVAQQYWNPVVNELGVTGAAISVAATELQGGDDVGAEQILARAADSADTAYQAAGSGTPPDGDTWQTIQGELLEASSSYKKAIQEFRDGLGDSNSETLANAVDDAQSAAANMQDATDQARQWYVEKGGHSSDLEDLQSARQAAMKLFRMLTQ